ncbi:MAG: isoleucine--tRNA ligase [Candidatus Symbiothrix sp.]|jgi:isoleucyl-tRNA synthetase|nr:isoleucine--tRNA ligase [Candidatus Symbiothrix sp.]
MAKNFSEYNKLDLAGVNQEILKRWEELDVFHKSLKIREGAPGFVFYEGPPSANGMPGIHHVIARSIKDIFCRYKTMKGFLVNRKAGWDTHGLPVELGVEKALGITKEDIGKKISVEEYNAACRKDVMKYTKEWEDLTNKMGYWVDMNDPYITYDNRYIETLWWLLKELYNKDLLYKGYTIQPYSPAAGTGLSSHELNQPGCYRDVKDTTCTAQFKIVNPLPKMSNSGSNFGEAFFLAWTTTPWTLPSNTALCVGPNIEYVAVHTNNPYTDKPMTAVLAKDLLPAYFKELPEIAGSWKGEELAGMEYEQLIPWVNPGKGAFRVITGDFVTTEDGTGIVHIAPTFGADDDRVAKANGVPPLMMIDKDGNQRPMVDLTGKFFNIEDLDDHFVKTHMNVVLYSEYAGRFVKNAYDNTLADDAATLDIDICVMLKQQNRAFKIEKHTHNYPHCWRTDKPVLYYPLDSWFIRSTAVKERMIELNDTINWKPQSTGSGRFGKWLENLNDWNLSRSRYWGTPLPIWRTEDGMEEKCIGSVAELIDEINKSVAAGLMKANPYKNFQPGVFTAANYAVENIDLHRPYVDDIILVSESGKPMKRETDLIDVWFDSGAMPFAQLHYPFENKELIDIHCGQLQSPANCHCGQPQSLANYHCGQPQGLPLHNYPADFISEGVDQTRGWFFTLHAISTMVKDSVAFKNVVSTGLVLDKNGNKMSKRLGNAVNPFETIALYGSDPLRWYMITNASPWDNLKFDADGIEEARRKFFGTLYNTYSFFALYANVDNFDGSAADVPFEKRPEIDRWILSLLNTLVKDVDDYYSTYEPTRAGRAINDFVNDHLSNWYVRLNRKRFWGGGMNDDKLSAYQTLYTCLKTVAQLMAPIAPFYSDKLYLDLVQGERCKVQDPTPYTLHPTPVSVHLTDFPKVDTALIDKDLEERMQIAQDISSMVLALRRKVNIKVRQPLSSIMVPVLDAHQKAAIEAVQALILNEVNVKEIKYVDSDAGILVKKIKVDFKKLGPRYGKIMKEVAAAITALPQAQINQLEKDSYLEIPVAGEMARITTDDVEIISEDIPGWLVANNGRLTVALDITLTPALEQEGIARELVNRIQNIRKSNGYEITDRISVVIQRNDRINAAVEAYKDEKANKDYNIANQVLANSVSVADLTDGVELDLDDFKLLVKIEKQ